MIEELQQLLKEIGENVEGTGQTIMRRHTDLSHTSLTHLRDTLNTSAESIQTVRDLMYPEQK